MPTTTTHATYTLDGGCSNCGATRSKLVASEYVRYDLALPINGEEGSSGEPFVAFVGLTDSRTDIDTDENEVFCADCDALLTNIEISDWRDSHNDRPEKPNLSSVIETERSVVRERFLAVKAEADEGGYDLDIAESVEYLNGKLTVLDWVLTQLTNQKGTTHA